MSAHDHVTRRIFQLIRSPTNPGPFPATITSGLSSTEPVIQRAALVELHLFIHDFFYLQFSSPFYGSLIATAAIVAVLILIGSVIVLHRIYHGRFWPFRYERRAQGLYIVPNAINCFLICEAVYAVALVCFNFITWKAFSYNHNFYIRQFPAWRLLVWIPLYIGAFLTGWGSFYTAPGALDRPSAARSKFSAKGALPWPTVVNFACLGTPFVLIASLLPPVVLATRQFSAAFDKYEQWSTLVDTLLAQDSADQLVANRVVDAVVANARDVWQSYSKSIWYTDIGFTLWSCWALFFLCFYIPAGGTLVFLLLRQVMQQKAALLSYQRKMEEDAAVRESGHQMLQTPTLSKLDKQRQQVGSHPLHKRPQSADSMTTGKTADSGKVGFVGLTAALLQFAPDSGHLQTEPRYLDATPTNPVAELRSAAPTEDVRAPAPPSRPISVFNRMLHKGRLLQSNKAAKRRSAGSGLTLRYQYLRRCLVNLMILYFGIIAAACLFLVCTLRLAIKEYESSLRDPTAVAHGIYFCGNLAAWVSSVFGALTIGSIIFRNFEQAAPESKEKSDGSTPPRRLFQRKNSNDPEDVREKPRSNEQGISPTTPAQVDITRTLPAVPESVGVETSIISRLESRRISAAHFGTTLQQTGSSERLGPFVLHPGDHSASRISGLSPYSEETPSVPAHWTSTKGRPAFGTMDAAPTRHAMDRDPTTSLPQDETESYGLISLIRMDEHAARLSDTLQPSSDTDKTYNATVTYDTTLVPTASTDEDMKVESYLVSPVSASISHAATAAQPGLATSIDCLSRQIDVRPDTPASRIARDWSLSQNVSNSYPGTPRGATHEFGAQATHSPSTLGHKSPPGTYF